MISVRMLEPSAGSLGKVRLLLNEVFPRAHHLTDSYLHWCYNQNPVGPALAVNAYSGDLLVGHLAAQPIRARLEEDEEVGLLAIHNVVRTGYRGKKINAMILDRFLEDGAAAGFGFVIGFTNVNTRNFVARRLPQFTAVASLEARIGFGPLPAGRPRDKAQFSRMWDKQTLDWRLARPGARYRMRSKNGQRIVYALPDWPGLAVELGRFTPEIADFELPRPSRLTPARLWIGLDTERQWAGRAYMTLPRKLRPSPLTMVFSDISGRGRKLDARRVHVDAMDLDAF